MIGELIFFGFVGAIILVPQILRHQERARLHETLRLAFERGQPVPAELIAALQSRRRGYPSDYTIAPEVVAGWQARPSVVPTAEGTVAAPPPTAPMTPIFFSQARGDLRRGLIWLAVGLGLVAAGGASYAGLYDVGGAQETFSLFSAFGAIPIFVGLTYLALAWFARGKTQP